MENKKRKLRRENEKKSDWKFWLTFSVIFITLLLTAYSICQNSKYQKRNDIKINKIIAQINETNINMEEITKTIGPMATNTESGFELDKESKICNDYNSIKQIKEEKLKCQRMACLNETNNLSLKQNGWYYFNSNNAREKNNCLLALAYLERISNDNESQCGFECYNQEETEEQIRKEEAEKVEEQESKEEKKTGAWVMVIAIIIVVLIAIIFNLIRLKIKNDIY